MNLELFFYLIICVALLPLIASWIVILLGPLCFTFAGGASALYCYLRRNYLKMKSQLERLYLSLDKLSRRLDNPIKVCACSKEINGKTHLAVQYVSDHGSFSHLVKCDDLNSAIAKIEYKISCNLECPSSMGHRTCVVKGRCPNQEGARNRFSEIYFKKCS